MTIRLPALLPQSAESLHSAVWLRAFNMLWVAGTPSCLPGTWAEQVWNITSLLLLSHARRVFMSMGGICSKGKTPPPKAFSTAIVVTKELTRLRAGGPHQPQLVGNFGKFYAITCPKCCVVWKNLYCCLRAHHHAMCRPSDRAANLRKFAKFRVTLPKGVSKQFLDSWELCQ